MKASAQIQLFSKITFVDRLLFTKHLSVMIKSGITIVEALQILTDQTKSYAFKKTLSEVLADIQNGKTLAKSLAKHPKVFDTFYVSLVDIGEQTGTLDDNLIYLAAQLSKEYSFKQKVRGALMYPVIVLSAAGIIGSGISLFVLPQLIDLFKGFDVKLPLTTQLLLGLAGIMRDYGIIIVGSGIGLIILFRFAITTRAIKPFWNSFLLNLPIVGKIIQNSELSMLTRSLGIMIRSGLPITTALEIESNISANEVFRGYSKKMLSAITSGRSLSQELLSNHYAKIPLIAAKMISVGEKTGKMDETLIYLGDFFEGEVDDATKNLSTIIEPIMLLFIGIIVAFIAFAIISPIYQLTGSINAK